MPELEQRFRAREGRGVSPAELRSWTVSLPELARVLDAPPFADAAILVELRMPLCGRRCDALLTGSTLAGIPCAVVVELKQWQQVGPYGLLGYVPDLDLAWREYDGYALSLEADVPAMVQRLLAARALGLRCRVVAGYCWRWSDPIGSTLVHDVTDPRFGTWSAPWIVRSEQDLEPMEHRYYRWATDDACFEQVGSIYSVQGFEFDRVGVIWGEDLVWRTDRWVAQLEKNHDKVFKRDLGVSGADAVQKLKNVYRVLLTRGMQGTALFVLDRETRAHVQRCLARHRVQREIAG